MSDKITILRGVHEDYPLTKTWTSSGRIKSYGREVVDPVTGKTEYKGEYQYRAEEKPVTCLRDVVRELQAIENDTNACVIRGLLRDGSEPVVGDNIFARNMETFEDVAHHWVMMDSDKYVPVLADPALEPEAAVREFIEAKLPVEFHKAACFWQLSCSAGAPGKTELKAHLWFWLSEPRRSGELKQWSRQLGLMIDSAVFHQVQIHYTAAPIIEPGASCPVEQRSGWIDGGDVELALDGWEVLERPLEDRRALDDPRSHRIPIIGAFCRAYEPAALVDELMPEAFEWGRGGAEEAVHITWLLGGGSPDGVCVTDDGLHLYSTHNTDPFENVPVHLWDMVRVHKFGHLDAHLSRDEKELVGFGKLPSDRAMYKFAKSLPDVVAELIDGDDQPATVVATPLEELPDQDELLDPEAVAPAQPSPAKKDTPLVVIDDEREKRVGNAQRRIERCATVTSLDQACNDVRLAEWSDLEMPRLVRAVQDKYKALTNTALPVADARKRLAPVRVTMFKHVDENGAPAYTIENVKALLDAEHITVRYNVISKDQEILVPNASFSVDNAANASLAVLHSKCHELGMRINSGVLQSFLVSIADANPFNPVLTWIESAPWDGVDRLDDWYATIESNTPNKRDLMRVWALQCIAILHNVGDIMARGVLVLSGPQYMGKSRWLRSLCTLPGAIQTGLELDVRDKDKVKKAVSYWITELGELDSTFRRSDLSALKAFISQNDDELRLPYAARSSKYPRRTSLAATVNEIEFLRDNTGNTRYWTVAACSVNADHGIDVQQLWAQVLALWRAGDARGTPAPHWLDAGQMLELEASNDSFTVADPTEEAVLLGFPWNDPLADMVWMTATDIAKRLKLDSGRAMVSRIGAVVRKINGDRRRRANGVALLEVPLNDTLDA